MSFSDDILRAYADGALDAATREVVAQALRQDPALEARFRQLQAQRSNAFAGFAPGEGGSQRQPAAARSAKVVQLHAARAVRAAPPPAAPQLTGQPAGAGPRDWSWSAWSGLAATLVLGLLAGAGISSALQREGLALIDGEGSIMTARGALAHALTQQLSGTPEADAPVRIGTSFLSKEGAYCRSFRLANGGGLACRGGTGWNITLYARMDSTGNEYLTPGNGMPRAVQDAVTLRSADTLDPIAERAARDRGWKR
ncbi:hypothetical protein CR152_13155 [Massilia violaceinigra]|uniref:Anti-sigma factor n=1 Tax=Massilia violaceinigra TaxID=2045208 RepID=A0A2D2DK47_9BURK|nr:hypothetical protein [Massilia violaceinigra]ATQ75358.1 hypothetical protein CR152_13155 [Massilia violaceinigra]